MTGRPAIVILSDADLPVAERIASAVGGDIHTRAITFTDAAAHIRGLFFQRRPILAVMAAGAIIRILAPVLADKRSEPPVLAIARDVSSIVPLLGGHHGGNDLARRLAASLGGHAAITTAGDIAFGIALDEPPKGYVLANPEHARSVMARLLSGASVRMEGAAQWLGESGLPVADHGEIALQITEKVAELCPDRLVYHPRSLVLGLGCERGAHAREVIALAEAVLAEGNFSRHSIACIASLDIKADEPAIHAAAEHFGVPARFFSASELEVETPRLANPSGAVFAAVGCHGVAEAAALAAAGARSELTIEKRKSQRATAAIARCRDGPLTELRGLARGRLCVIGIGPGQAAWRSPEAQAIIATADDLVGYTLYLDLAADIPTNACRHDFPLGGEEDRVRHALELAAQGRSVALVCSGDPGIYAMASLVFEVLDRGGLPPAAKRIEILVAPGISALQAAAARAGAPLGHDFCAISLSDLLTPWPQIEDRLHAAGKGDFVVALYNPVSRKRRGQLEQAREILLRYRKADTPVIIARNLGRPGESVRVISLRTLTADDADMLSIILVGSSQSRMMSMHNGRQWVYTPRGYCSGQEDCAP